jgi:hypothetical protein
MRVRPKIILLWAAALTAMMLLFPPLYVEFETEITESTPGPFLVGKEFYGYTFVLASPPPVGCWGYWYRIHYGLLSAQLTVLWVSVAVVLSLWVIVAVVLRPLWVKEPALPSHR